MSHSPKLYDLTILEEFGEADSPFMKEVVTVFVVNGRKDIELLQTAVEQGKMEDIFQVVHRMKSTLHTMGIHSLEGAVKTLNHYSRYNEHPEEIPQLFEAVKQTLLVVFEQLTTDFSLV